ncbi:hypothetical protein [Yersinia aldovae]|uniref:Uncharacterized protein n=1 Tax=Yersinia aldovae TaxID=29483 RepID=A0ABM9ST27_YERAL|nr:hypothetical protein [Yersinia aldovae]CNL04190.1 Uncharacterised protein [Yersinia aldovae]
MLSKDRGRVSKERLEYLASLKGHVGQAVTMCRVELSGISTELLSLREQLAELKALEPIAWRNRFTGYLHSNKPGIIDNFYDELFTAAKPAED